MQNAKKFYITTAIDYVNARPHIGHALEKIQADVLARYHRIKGDDVFFLTGTDEHGVKIARAAAEAGENPQEFTDAISQEFRGLKEILDLSWDDFIRTTDRARHWPGAQKLWVALLASGDLYKKKYRGLYCVGHEAFVTEKDLVDGKCRDHQKAPEVIEEENYFFRLSKYGKDIESRIKDQELRIIPKTRESEILSFIHAGLEDVSFSRPRKDISWGIPVPNDPEHTMYVWCDALTNYLTGVGYGQDDSKLKTQNSKLDYWPADIHVIGKDILRFHAAIWPGMLLSADLPLPRSVFVHGFITVEGQKMSKTIGNVVDPVELVKKYGTDPVRYFLLREIPTGEDGDFSFEKLEARYNGDLANGIGNLVARVATLGERISPISFDFKKDITSEVDVAADQVFKAYEAHIAEFHLNDALADIWKLVSIGDKYINEKKPWEVKDADEFRKIIVNASYLIATCASLLRPFLPDTAEKITTQIACEESRVWIKKGDAIFPRLP